jgi:hypothetical protein
MSQVAQGIKDAMRKGVAAAWLLQKPRRLGAPPPGVH